ncbi:CRISPR system precrRNA processing endoribonuclease RAMP protein Cas6 [Cyanobacteria bacterium FACHB-472]|nr:CRISPR system precrRNA processing endoribonuclease RAMP protein Cas6 [Cyanobacteria bacterium FACHB-472]
MEPVMSLQPHKSQTLYSLVVELAAADRGHIPPTLSRALHGLVMNWLNLGNPQIADSVHASQESPLSLSGLLGNRRPRGTQAGDNFYFRVCLLDGSLMEPLLVGIEKWGTQPLVLGQFAFALRSIYTLPGTHRLAGSADYRLLANTPQTTIDIELNFLSPTSFKQSRGIQPFPLPELVFGSLLRRWNAFAPEELNFPAVEWEGLVSAYELKTYALKMEGGSEIGSQGWVRYRFPNAEQAKLATVLAHFAFFSGVGRKTSMGMGQAQLATHPLSKRK